MKLVCQSAISGGFVFVNMFKEEDPCVNASVSETVSLLSYLRKLHDVCISLLNFMLIFFGSN